ncbi:MAG: hypothetical protein QGH60_23555 [Phycisphaerae bacterium]|jgi:hypothetical protein|nr:hypothetical protein [Phycisphaerae bacterium]
MNSNHNNQMSSRIVGGRKFLLMLALLALVLSAAAPAQATARANPGGIISTGTVVLNKARRPYAMIFDPSSGPPCYYIRIRLGEFRIMHLHSPQPKNGKLVLKYTLYNTMGRHRTPWGRADDMRSWIPESAGLFYIDHSTLSKNGMTFMRGSVSGVYGQTHRAYPAVSGKWRRVNTSWWKVKFSARKLNQKVMLDWLRYVKKKNSIQS